MSKSIALICAYNNFDIFTRLSKQLMDTATFTTKKIIYDNTNNRLFNHTVDLFNCVLKENSEDILLFVHQDINGAWDKFSDFILNWQDNWGIVGATDERKKVTKIHGRLESVPQEAQLIDGHCMGGRRELFMNIPKRDYWGSGPMEVCLISLAKGYKNIVIPNKIFHQGGSLIGHPGFYETITYLEQKYKVEIKSE